MESEGASPTAAWPRCPDAAEYFTTLFRAFTAHNPDVGRLADRCLEQAGVRLMDLVDHWVVPRTYSLDDELRSIGMRCVTDPEGDPVWEHPAARLPRLRTEDSAAVRMAIAVEDLRMFADCNDLPNRGQHGDPDSGYEEIRFPQPAGELAVVVRRGYRGFRAGSCTAADERTLERARRAMTERRRDLDGPECARTTAALLSALSEELDRDRLVDEFFAIEREFYMLHNGAARRQYERQQELGLGWANHDHHTYRSSRSRFMSLMALWLQLGFEAREKFYAGAEAGWGAQILEHPVSKVVLFCDVDMAPSELDIDFATQPLPDLPSLGTIGLWCGLHGDSIARAGLHHLEAEFDFPRARDLLISEGVGVMAPFTDLPMLKQAFTIAETWPVAADRAARLCEQGYISEVERDRFVAEGAAGSHLEILQRWEGFKGFNKTGVDAIIRETDARGVRG